MNLFDDIRDRVRDLVVWPEEGSFTEEQANQLLQAVHRLIDFDGTICRKGTMEPSNTLCGRPLAEFLADEPYVVQTFDPVSAKEFFVRNPHLPQPAMIMAAPIRIDGPGLGVDGWGKDFDCLGLRGKLIIDDLAPQAILAPGCKISPP